MDKIVGTTEAAFVLVRVPLRLTPTRGRTALLNICVSRVKVLLQQQRIKGATKEGRVWKIPLIRGIPQVKECNRGLKGTWRRKRCDKTTRIHVNKPQINHNRKHKTLEPVITIRQGSRKTYCHLAEVKGSCQIVYQPDNPLPCGAVVWIESPLPWQAIALRREIALFQGVKQFELWLCCRSFENIKIGVNL